MKQIIKGLKNTQRVRVIVNGVGFSGMIKDITNMCFTSQRVAVVTALEQIAKEGITGFGSTMSFYDQKLRVERIDFQVDLL
jgi:hypothetical protein